MKRSKHNVVLFTNRIGETALRWFPGKCEVIEVSPIKRAWFFERLYPLIIKLPLDNADVFIASLGEVLGEAVIIRNNSVPTLGYFNGLWKFTHLLEKRFGIKEDTIKKIYGLLLLNVFNSYNEIVANSNFVKNSLLKWVRLKKKVHVIHPGVDTSYFRPAGIYDNYFLVVSRIEPLKRLELAIQSFNIFKSLCNSRFRLIVAGYLDPKNRSYLNYLTKTCKRNVDFEINPSDEDLLKLYQNCYAFLFPSFNEPFGIAPLEAMSCGKPVIATGQGGFQDYLIDNYNGFLTFSNPSAIARKMLLLAQNYDLVVSMGQKARITALAFDWKRFTEQMDRLVERMASEQS
jgi:glycosyltransferase involved in cell wall biosynthesis